MSVTDRAIEMIKEMIVSGRLSPGARLPKEDVLAERLGLSRNSLREAVRAMAAMRILDVRHGDGTYVSSLEPHLLLETLSFASDVSRGAAARQLLQVRRMVEPQATAAAAALIDDARLRELREILDRCAAAESVEEFVSLDNEFHHTIAATVGNPVLTMLLRVLSVRTHQVRVARGADTEAALQSAHREHESILRALRARDPQLAGAAAAVHVAAVEQWLGECDGQEE
ncbi:FCD domain-containing protein [Streptomyces sp. TRM43335]|uniref:FCD domain-containing protein n=1 Tax=Streptomyces taklimakanensis TaxID=2569853 RepID=A0A6G2BJ21_9ACTN|nr:FCD domain-containing protein [Streptomyces taklimakanensis]MTE22281.1 FCD domain-containing protein [Streptomyces taklimakanensis]